MKDKDLMIYLLFQPAFIKVVVNSIYERCPIYQLFLSVITLIYKMYILVILNLDAWLKHDEAANLLRSFFEKVEGCKKDNYISNTHVRTC